MSRGKPGPRKSVIGASSHIWGSMDIEIRYDFYWDTKIPVQTRVSIERTIFLLRLNIKYDENVPQFSVVEFTRILKKIKSGKKLNAEEEKRLGSIEGAIAVNSDHSDNLAENVETALKSYKHFKEIRPSDRRDEAAKLIFKILDKSGVDVSKSTRRDGAKGELYTSSATPVEDFLLDFVYEDETRNDSRMRRLHKALKK